MFTLRGKDALALYEMVQERTGTALPRRLDLSASNPDQPHSGLIEKRLEAPRNVISGSQRSDISIGRLQAMSHKVAFWKISESALPVSNWGRALA